MRTYWHNLSVTKKLYGVVGLMAILIASELFTLLFAMSTLSSVRAFVMGEGLWTKAQKDAIQSLYQYAYSGDDAFLKNFQSSLKIPDGDHAARLALLQPRIDLDAVRQGFLDGGNHPDDIPGMIRLLTNFHSISYIHGAIVAWTQADLLLDQLKVSAQKIEHIVQAQGVSSPELVSILKEITVINANLTREEIAFSSSLGAGSRWLESLLMTILALTVLTIESTGLFLTFRFCKSMNRSLTELTLTAAEVGKGHFDVLAPVRSGDEFGRLAESLNRMVRELKGNILKSTLAEENVRKTDEKFRLLVDAVKDYAIYMVDENGFLTTWNSGAKNLTGYESQQILGQHFSIFFTADDILQGVPQTHLKIAQETGRFEGDIQRVRRDGSTFWANIIMTALFDSAGQLAGFSNVIRDITERRLIESQLKMMNTDLEQRIEYRTREANQREAQLRLVTNSIPTLVAQLDRNEIFLFANESFCQWFKLNPSDVIGKNYKDILGPERYEQNRPHIRNVLDGNVSIFERKSTIDAVSAVYDITFVPEFDDSGNKTVGFVLVAADVTKYKEIEAELIQAKRAAESANAAKSSFLANMSHEIRTPVGAILGFSTLLSSSKMSAAERAETVEIINRNGKLLTNIIDDILDLSKVEAGKLEIETVEVPLEEIITDIKSLLNLKAQEKGVDLRIFVDKAVPETVKTDPLRLRQILLNVVGNAIKFTDHGTVDVNIQTETESVNQAKLIFTVHDTGRGITDDQASKLFTAFTQADASTTRQFGGTGLGLILSKKLANSLGGDVVLRTSTPGQGSIFVVSVNVSANKHVTLTPKNIRHKPNELSPNTAEKLRIDHLQVLLVDDSPDNQLLMSRYLASGGATVDTANNGQEAVEKALHKEYNVVLMDLQMPVMDGYSAVKELRRQHYTKPIIALTAHAMKEERKTCMNIGFDEHISKPVSREALIRVVAEFSRNQSS